MINFDKDDVSLDLAIQAHQGVSMVPEKRGARIQQDYVAFMQYLLDKYTPFATDENREEMAKDLTYTKDKYLELLKAYLHSYSNVISVLITGPSNFPSRRNEKRGRWADNHLKKFLDFCNKTQDYLSKKYDPVWIAQRPIRSDEDDAIERLEQKIASLAAYQEKMKAVNKIIRAKKLDQAARIEALSEYGLSDREIIEVLTPNYMNKIGYDSWQLSNNNANIRSNKQRLETLKRERDRLPTEPQEYEGFSIVENTEVTRLQILFDGKPGVETRTWLKKHGFRWSPRNGVWQRLLNGNARYAAKQFVEWHKEKE